MRIAPSQTSQTRQTSETSRASGSHRHVLARMVALLAVVALPLLVAGPARAAAPGRAATPGSTTGWVRMAHLSPGTAAVDVWLTPFGGAAGPATLTDVTYGSISAYRTVAAGYYTVAMRPAGSPASTPAMLSQTVQVSAGKAYSVLAVGQTDSLTLRVVPDDLATPAAARSRVRLIQASTVTGAVDVRAVMGPVLVDDAAYGLVSPYTEVPQGRWNLQIAAATGSAPPATVQVDLRAGSVTTLLVLNGASGSALVVKPVTDAAAAAVMPKGGVETGEGGTASWVPSPLSLPSVPAGTLAAVVLGLATMYGTLVLRAARRRPAR